MAYRIPTFNILVDIRRYETPIDNPADVTTVAQLKAGFRGYGITTIETSARGGGDNRGFASACPRLLLLPKGTDVRRPGSWGNGGPYGDTIEIPAGSGMQWLVQDVFDVAYAFPNEFRVAQIVYVSFWPSPLPWPAGS